MYVVAFGFVWVLWGYTYTNTETENTKRDINGLAGYDPGHVWPGNFPKKDIYV